MSQMMMAVCATSQRSVLSVTLPLRLRARSCNVPGTFGRFGIVSLVCGVATAAADSTARNDLLCISSSLSSDHDFAWKLRVILQKRFLPFQLVCRGLLGALRIGGP